MCPLQSHNSASLVHFFGMRNSEALKFSRAKLLNSDNTIVVFPIFTAKEKPVQKVMTKAPLPSHTTECLWAIEGKKLPPVLLLKFCPTDGLSTWLLPVTAATEASRSSWLQQDILIACHWLSDRGVTSKVTYPSSTKHRKPRTQRKAERKSFWREIACCR